MSQPAGRHNDLPHLIGARYVNSQITEPRSHVNKLVLWRCLRVGISELRTSIGHTLDTDFSRACQAHVTGCVMQTGCCIEAPEVTAVVALAVGIARHILVPLRGFCTTAWSRCGITQSRVVFEDFGINAGNSGVQFLAQVISRDGADFFLHVLTSEISNIGLFVKGCSRIDSIVLGQHAVYNNLRERKKKG